MHVLPRLLVVILFAMLAALGGCAPYSVRVIDPSGAALPITDRLGVSVAKGQLGQAYAIEVTNLTNRHVAVMVSVDGLDTMEASPADVSDEGLKKRRFWIADPYTRTIISGYVVSSAKVARFRFADASEALATQVGSPSGVGQIVVHLFPLVRDETPAAPASTPSTPAVETEAPHYIRAAAIPAAAGSGTAAVETTPAGAPAPAPALVLTGESEPFHVDPHALLLRRFAFAYEDQRGQMLGTAGPTPVAAPTAPSAITRGDAQPDTDVEGTPPGDEADGPPPKGGKPSKRATAPKPVKNVPVAKAPKGGGKPPKPEKATK